MPPTSCEEYREMLEDPSLPITSDMRIHAQFATT